MEEGTQIERECLREGEGVDQEKLCTRKECVGGGARSAARAECGAGAELAWRGRGAMAQEWRRSGARVGVAGRVRRLRRTGGGEGARARRFAWRRERR